MAKKKETYEDQVAFFFPAAEKEARAKTAAMGKVVEVRLGVDKHPYRFDYWTLYFHQAMNRMTREAGLRCL